jgi:hypothetical protein
LKLGRAVLQQWRPCAAQTEVGLPAVPPERTDLQFVPQGSPRDWLHQRLVEFVARRSAWSSYFQFSSAANWAALTTPPDHSPEIERRHLLTHLVSDGVPSISPLRWLPDAACTANPAIWRALIDTARSLATATAVAATNSSEGAARATRPHTGSALASAGVLTDFTAHLDLPTTLLRT